jgi:ABC-type dipeptide/oligopeptide/nickel transport system permease component
VRLARAIAFRLFYGLLSLLFITFVTFIANEISPGDPALIFAGEKATPGDIVRIRHNMGLDRPWYTRYGEFLVNSAKGDFGNSYYGTKEPVVDIIKRNLPMTLRIASLAITLAALLGIVLGTFAAIYQNRGVDRSVLTFSTLGVTLPNFVLAPVLVYIFALQLDRLPQGWDVNHSGSDIPYLILPVIILAARPMAMLTRLTRASMVDTMQQEFIRTAIAKGVPTPRLVVHHALRNAILPVITAIGTSWGFLLTGSFVVETYFTLPGLGFTTIEAIQQKNIPVIQACILITGMMFVVINLAVDIILPILDPRIREAQV